VGNGFLSALSNVTALRVVAFGFALLFIPAFMFGFVTAWSLIFALLLSLFLRSSFVSFYKSHEESETDDKDFFIPKSFLMISLEMIAIASLPFFVVIIFIYLGILNSGLDTSSFFYGAFSVVLGGSYDHASEAPISNLRVIVIGQAVLNSMSFALSTLGRSYTKLPAGFSAFLLKVGRGYRRSAELTCIFICFFALFMLAVLPEFLIYPYQDSVFYNFMFVLLANVVSYVTYLTVSMKAEFELQLLDRIAEYNKRI